MIFCGIFSLPESFTQLIELTSLCMNDISLNRIPPDIGRLVSNILFQRSYSFRKIKSQNQISCHLLFAMYIFDKHFNIKQTFLYSFLLVLLANTRYDLMKNYIYWWWFYSYEHDDGSSLYTTICSKLFIRIFSSHFWKQFWY